MLLQKDRSAAVAAAAAAVAGTVSLRCQNCGESTDLVLDAKLLTSGACGHSVCTRCLAQVAQLQQVVGTRVGVPGGRVVPPRNCGSSSGQLLPCPICEVAVAGGEWLDRRSEDNLLEQAHAARLRVSSVYNSVRQDFENTPAYNDFLERREEMIWSLSQNPDAPSSMTILQELEAHELEFQQQIVEARQRETKAREDEIRFIVGHEGSFYAGVQQDYIPGKGFRQSGDSQHLLHPLQRKFPELFEQLHDNAESANGGAASRQVPLPATVVTIGQGGQPRPLTAHLDYDKIPKRSATDRSLFSRACGFSKEVTGTRMIQEFWGGLTFFRTRRSSPSTENQK